ncbi:G-type lectin S-receptor-like serine/threonine-protein kinase At4g27290 [Mercurialis annua]|uniref:G-type lectin S-receptor-like serine/threonine-protein kinase At4g27290 n=1 Tax=Mercurialis annua TaxID=3986 RepID=UPI00215F7326|nr:G-type lectin S-receptor-like serine/threonine-protein kinase At4g27290 [Mercurialis annua]
MDYSPLLVCCYLLLTTTIHTEAADTINTTQSIRDGEALVSAGGSFKLGFFSPGTSKNRYLGIWYNTIPTVTVVWVANRENPVMDSSGVLNITDQGTLIIVNRNGTIVWSSNFKSFASNPIAQLLDSGNFVIKEQGNDNSNLYLWQSFHYPSDTLLPGMKLGRNRVTGLDANISSWKTPTDPARGKFIFGFDQGGYPEMIITEDSAKLYRTGPWNGLRFSGTPSIRSNPIYSDGFVFNQDEVYYNYELLNSSLLLRMVINQQGVVEQLIWVSGARGWMVFRTLMTDQCDNYAMCGTYGSCNINNSPMCSCLKGFVPKVPREWNVADWSNGCVRKTPLACSQDEFLKFTSVKLPETRTSWSNVAGYMAMNMSLDECHFLCMKNCNCSAYANLDIRGGGSDCLLWFNELIDVRDYTEGGQDMYVRMAASELVHINATAKSNVQKRTAIAVSSVLSTGLLLLVLALILYWRRKRQKNRKLKDMLERNANIKGHKEDQELTMFDLGTIARATDNFSLINKLGEGGFGPVYKGMLKDGQDIAVKRLSESSKQGIDELKNEVTYIAKLQHRNLVKILGCCIQADEMMLIYEFMPNKSLDFFIFDETHSTLLGWPKRYHIINGIARGLLYLHQDSRLRIVHRDLKAGNILLDCEMNPKISDFGLARSFGGDETEANTNKVVGTYGYMSPEYAIDGLYSVKSDVFSFGVMVLEIVSGKRNRGFYHPEHYLNLLGHAWKLHKEGRASELIAASMEDLNDESEALRSIQIGLLCVQRSAESRPTMSSVVLMLGGEGALPEPKEPGFFTEREIIEAKSSSTHKLCSPNGLSISLLEAR